MDLIKGRKSTKKHFGEKKRRGKKSREIFLIDKIKKRIIQNLRNLFLSFFDLFVKKLFFCNFITKQENSK